MLDTANMTRDEVQKVALDFLKEKRKDHLGRSVSDYLSMDEDQMEFDHEWVQWAFPIDTVSPHNPHSGLMFSGANTHFKFNCVAYKNQGALLTLYLATIGIAWDADSYFYLQDEPCDADKFFAVVDSPYNHHIKRISRVLRHLMLSGQSGAARNLFKLLLRSLVAKKPTNFTSYTVAYWTAIVYNFSDQMTVKP